MGIKKERFGRLGDGRGVERYRLMNRSGMRVEIITYGAAVTRLFVPDRQGRLQDVVLGYDTLEEYQRGDKFFGAVIGRYANRIAGGSFVCDGREYSLTQNEKSGATLHGGDGFDRRVWSVVESRDGDEPSLTLSYHSPDGEEGFPGNLDVTVTYCLTDGNALDIRYRAVADQETPINLTNHSYFNLTGDASKTVLSHQLCVDGTYFTPVTPDGIPTGDLLSVEGTAFDFTHAKAIGQDIHSGDPRIVAAQGYDHNYVLSAAPGIRRAARVCEPESGRVMEVFTDKPGMQLYTGNFLQDTDVGKEGVLLEPYRAFCLETQFFPDSVHQSRFPTPFFKAGQAYAYTTRYCFSTDQE